MKRVKGLVLEISKKQLIILTAEGDYLRVPHPGGRVNYGDEVLCRLYSPLWLKVSAAAVGVAAALLILFTPSLLEISPGGIPWAVDEVEGYLIIDINPSFELTYDENLKVTTCTPFNEEAVLLLEECPRGEQLEKAVDLLLDRSVFMGFLDPEQEHNLVLVTLVRGGEEEIPLKQIGRVIDDRLSQLGVSAYIGVFEADKQTREEAIAVDISLNRYLLAKALKQQDKEDVPPGASLLEMLTALVEHPSGSLFNITGKPEVPIQFPLEIIDLPEPSTGPPSLPVLEEVPPAVEERQRPGQPEPPEPPGDVPGRVPGAPNNSEKQNRGEAPFRP